MSERGSDRETGERPSGEGREGRPDETRRFSNAPGRRYSSRDDSNGRGGRETIRSAKGHERGAGRDPPRVSRRVAVGSSREPREGARDASAHHAGVFERRELGAELGEDARVDHGRARAEVVLPLGRLLHCEGGWRVRPRNEWAKKRRLRRGRRRTCAARGVRGGAADEGSGSDGRGERCARGCERRARATVDKLVRRRLFLAATECSRDRDASRVVVSVSRRARLVGDSQEKGEGKIEDGATTRGRARPGRARSRRSIAAGRESIANAGGNPRARSATGPAIERGVPRGIDAREARRVDDDPNAEARMTWHTVGPTDPYGTVHDP